MPSQLGQEVLFSVPLPLAIAVLLLLGLLVGMIVWLMTRRRFGCDHTASSTFALANAFWLPALLEQLPCGALLIDAQGQVELANGQARRWLGIVLKCQGDSDYADLGRQELTATPYALYALGAPWGGLTGVPADLADGDDDTTSPTAT